MKGNNEMELNTATMIQAVQEWLERRWVALEGESAPKVSDVSLNSNAGNYSPTFKVRLTIPREEAE